MAVGDTYVGNAFSIADDLTVDGTAGCRLQIIGRSDRYLHVSLFLGLAAAP